MFNFQGSEVVYGHAHAHRDFYFLLLTFDLFMITDTKTSRLNSLFQKKKKEIINVYCTAGFPAKESTLEVMKALQEAGADIIELGIPYSDPLADGPVIQASSSRALQNGMSIPVLLQQLKGFRTYIS